MSLPEACIFDLDGVIVDTVPAHYVAWKEIANELGISFTKEDNEQLKGVSRTESMKRILTLGDMEKSDEEILDYTNRKNAIYVDIISKMTKDDILPGVLTFLDQLKANNIQIAVGSSSKNTPTILKAVGLDKAFATVVDGNQIIHSKPDPEVFLIGARRLGFAPEDCVVFEDAYSGVEAALNGNFKCIGVGQPEVLGKAHKVIPNLKNIDIEVFSNL